jgi:hypothetical protein
MPDWKPEIRRLAPLKPAPAREAEIAEELSQHLEDRYQEFLSRGLTENPGVWPTLPVGCPPVVRLGAR